MASWLALYGPVIARIAGADVPLSMLLGHVQIESGGRPNERTRLDERGLMQIHPGTSREMGFDHDQMFNPGYSIWAGVEMFRRMAARLQQQNPGLFPRGRDEFFWRVVRFDFAIGSGALRKILVAMQNDRFQPRTWEEFKRYITLNRTALLRSTSHDPVKWADNVDRVFSTGDRLVRTGVVVAGGAGAVILLAAAGVILWLWSRNGEPNGDRHATSRTARQTA